MATRPASRTRKPTTRKPAKRKRLTVRSPIKLALFKCRRCKLTTNNPLARIFHTCLVGFSTAQKRAIGERTAAQKAAARRNLQTARQAKRKAG